MELGHVRVQTRRLSSPQTNSVAVSELGVVRALYCSALVTEVLRKIAGEVMPNRRSLLRKPWSPEDDAKLLALLERGYINTTFIATRLRRTPAAVHRRKAMLRFTQRTRDLEDKV